MRRYFLCVLLVVSMLLNPITTNAATEGLTEGRLEDGTCYALASGGMAISIYKGTESNIVIPYNINGFNIKYINHGAYANVDTVKTVILPSTLTSVGSTAFTCCDSLEKVVFTSQSEIARACFAICPKLKEINLPDTLMEIPESAFSDCTSLAFIRIPTNVELIDYHAFENCTSLTSVVIPEKCREIESDAFANCTSLSEIYMTNGAVKIWDDAFLNVTATVYYDASNPYWTEEDFQDYGGNLTWVPTDNIPVIEDPGLGKYPDGVGRVSVYKGPELPTNPKENGDLVVVLNPMHDSTHAGIKDGGYNETDINLKIAKYCYEELYTYSGVKVYLTRTDSNCPYPETCGQSNGAELDELKRIEFAKSVNADVYISIHLAHETGGGWSGTTIEGPLGLYKEELHQETLDLARHFLKNLEELGITDRGYTSTFSTDGSTYKDGSTADANKVIRKSVELDIPAIILEQCTLINSPDAENCLSTEAKIKALGVADAKSIADYYGLEKGYNPNKGKLESNTPAQETEKGSADNNGTQTSSTPSQEIEKETVSEQATETIIEDTEAIIDNTETMIDDTEEQATPLETEDTQFKNEQQDIDSDNIGNQNWPIVLIGSIGVIACVTVVGFIWKLKIKKIK